MYETKAPIAQLAGVDCTELYERFARGSFDAAYLVDKQRRIAHWNGAAEALSGFSPAEVRNRCCYDVILVHVDDHGTQLCEGGCPLQLTLSDGNEREAKVYFRHKLGHRVPVVVRTEPVRDEAGNVVAAIEVFRDARTRKDFERRITELEKLAYLDPLMQIPNRRYVEQQVTHLMRERNSESGSVGLVLFDLDDFKRVNDGFGHPAGDAVLQSVAKTLVGTLRDSDLVGRWGGEEFLAVMPDLRQGALETLAERCRTLIGKVSVPWEGKRIQVTASAGATCIRSDDDLATVLARVDSLLYTAKNHGRNRLAIG